MRTSQLFMAAITGSGGSMATTGVVSNHATVAFAPRRAQASAVAFTMFSSLEVSASMRTLSPFFISMTCVASL